MGGKMSKGVGWWNHASTMLIHSELFQIFLPIIQVFIQKYINHKNNDSHFKTRHTTIHFEYYQLLFQIMPYSLFDRDVLSPLSKKVKCLKIKCIWSKTCMYLETFNFFYNVCCTIFKIGSRYLVFSPDFYLF